MARVGVKPPSQSEGRCTDARAAIRPARRSIRSHVTTAGYICGTKDGSDVSTRCLCKDEARGPTAGWTAPTAARRRWNRTDRRHTDRRTARRTVLTYGTDVAHWAGSLSSCPGGLGGSTDPRPGVASCNRWPWGPAEHPSHTEQTEGWTRKILSGYVRPSRLACAARLTRCESPR